METITKQDVTVTPQYGSLLLSTVVKNERVKKQYIGFSKRGAMSLFLNDVNKL